MIKVPLILLLLYPVTSSRNNHNAIFQVGDNGSRRSLKGNDYVNIDSSPKFDGMNHGDASKEEGTNSDMKSSTEKHGSLRFSAQSRGLSGESTFIRKQTDPKSATPTSAMEWGPSMSPPKPLHRSLSSTTRPSESPLSLSSTSISELPTQYSMVLASAYPTVVPTVVAPEQPGLPTTVPTLMPSSLPSDLPSVVPTTIPTTAPTAVPSALPSDFPSRVPSSKPSCTTTYEPTLTPSFPPSDFPSTVPTVPAESLMIIDTGMDNLRRYGKQWCDETADPDIGPNMQRVVINYKYSLRVEAGNEPIVAMGSIEEFITDFLRKYFCASFTKNGRRVSASRGVVFTASPADMLNGIANIDNTYVDGGFTLWIENDTMDGTSQVTSTVIVCELLNKIQAMFANGTLSHHPGIHRLKLESITSCQAAMAVNVSFWQLSFMVVGSGAFVVLAVVLAMRHFYVSKSQKAIERETMKVEEFYFDVTVTETADTTICTREDVFRSRSDLLYSSWSETGYIYRDSSFNESHSSPGSIHSEFAVAEDNEHCQDFDVRDTIVIDSKLFSLRMKTIPEARIIESSSNEDDDDEEEGYETIQLD